MRTIIFMAIGWCISLALAILCILAFQPAFAGLDTSTSTDIGAVIGFCFAIVGMVVGGIVGIRTDMQQ
jgi:DNA-binding transcriptional regulator of glucitol operon